jgi:hypothetical protein
MSTWNKVVLFCLELERNQNKDWLLVAAGLERFFFVIYTVAFAIVSSAYIWILADITSTDIRQIADICWSFTYCRVKNELIAEAVSAHL